jgi:hypothetical protein
MKLSCVSLTINVAMYHSIMDTGRATMYLILPVKLNSKKIFPRKPQHRDPRFM